MTSPLFFLNNKYVAIGLLVVLVTTISFAFAASIANHDPDCAVIDNKRKHTHRCIVDKIEEVFQAVLNISTGTASEKIHITKAFEYDDDLAEQTIMRLPDDQEGILEEITCEIRSAGAWASAESVDLTVEVVTDEASFTCEILGATEPTFEFVDEFDVESTVPLTAGSTVTITCTSSGDDEGCAGEVQLWTKLRNIVPEPEE